MSAEFLWVPPGETPSTATDLSGHILMPGPGEDGFRLASQAEQGSVGGSELIFDDPDGTLYVQGLNALLVRESTSVAADPYVYAGGFASRHEERGTYRTGPSRIVRAVMTDTNIGLSKYVIRADEDGDRPEETDTDRMDWLLGTSAFDNFDTGASIIDTAGVTLSKADLTDYTSQQILDDMAQQSGRNYFVYYDGENEVYLLVYALDSGTHLTSDLRFSNVESDHDGVTTFARNVGLDWSLEIDPSRVASYVALRYANGRVDENDAGTAAEFTRVDKVMDASLIKTAGVATSRALQYLDELDTEESIISGSVYLPAELASQFRAGMRVEMKASHLTGMSDFVWVRLLMVTITSISEDPTLTYALAFEGTFTASTPASCAAIVDGLVMDISGDIGAESEPLAGPSISPGTGDQFVLALMLAGQDSTCIAGPSTNGSLDIDSPWTMIDGFKLTSDTNCEHTFTGVAYRHNAGGTTLWDWEPGGTVEEWKQASVLIPTATTAPLQVAAAQLVTGSNIVFPGDVTPGNLLVGITSVEATGGGVTLGLPGWTFVGNMTLSDKSLQVFCKCAEEGDGVDGDMRTFNMWASRSGTGFAHWSFGFELPIT